MSTMYRGINGNPANCIAFKAVFGSQSRIVEPERAQRNAGVRCSRSVAHVFLEGDMGRRVPAAGRRGRGQRNSIYELGSTVAGRYRPCPAYAYLGSNQSLRQRRRDIPGRDVPPSLDR